MSFKFASFALTLAGSILCSLPLAAQEGTAMASADMTSAPVATVESVPDTPATTPEVTEPSTIATTDSIPPMTPDSFITTPHALAMPRMGLSTLDTTPSLSGSLPVDIPEAAPLPIDEIRALLRTSGRGVLRYSPLSAVMASLEANRELSVQKLRPSISEQGIDAALSEFDPTFVATIAASDTRRSTLSARPRESGPDDRDQNGSFSSRSTEVGASIGARIPTGTNVSVDLGATRDRNSRTRDFYGADASLNVTQNILRGRGVNFNMARVRIARNDLEISRHQLEAFLINLVSDTLVAYADLYLARETLRIRIESWEVAGQQADQNDEFLRVGRATPLDSLTGRAEQSSRAGDVINAAAQLRIRQLALARLTGGFNQTQGRNFRADLSLAQIPVPAIIPKPPRESVNPTERIRVAMAMRPELAQAQLELDNAELEVVRTTNGLLPRLDFIVRVGTSGVGDSFGNAIDTTADANFGNWRAGLELEVPLGNRAARAADRRARFSRDLAEAAIANLRQQIELEVRQALVEVERAQRLILTTGIARRQREQSLFNERQRLAVGSGTRLEVVQAERDLIQAQIDQVSAEVALAKAYIELHRAEGSTLIRTGVSPVTAVTLSQATGTPVRNIPMATPAAASNKPARNRAR